MFRDLFFRVRTLLRRETAETELDEEVRFHIQQEAEKLVRSGLTHEEALRRARMAFGGLDQVKEECREARGTHLVETALQDVRFGLRMLRKSRGFTAVAVLTLALGIGANVAIFGLWKSVSHSSLPVVYKPDQLVALSNPDEIGTWTGRLSTRADGDRPWLTYSEFEQLRDRADGFSSLMASQSPLDTWALRVNGGDWESGTGRLVSGGYFDVLGIRPLIGRVFTPGDDTMESPNVVISYNYWQRRFGGRSDVLGKNLAFRTADLTVIGVTPPGFIGETNGQQPDFWIPLQMQPRIMPGKDWLHDKPPQKTMWLNVFGRLRDGVTQPQAEAQANAIFQVGLESFYGTFSSEDQRRDFLDQHLRIRSAARGASGTRSEFSGSLTAMLAAVGVLLLIACTNLSNLLLSRTATRKSEMALRSSVGASRGRLVRQLATESLALACIGGIVGLGAAYFFFGALVQMLESADPDFRVSFSIDPAILVFCVTLILTVALLFGLLPVWQIAKTSLAKDLKGRGRVGGGSPAWMRWSRSLVSLQLALSLPLLFGAGLLVRTLHNLQHVDLGFATQHLVLARVDASYGKSRNNNRIYELLDRFRTIPGVRNATFSLLGVFSGGNSIDGIEVQGYTPKEESDRHSATDAVGPDYFSTLGVPIVEGREIEATDHQGTPAVCVINEAFVKHFFQGRNPIGMHVTSVSDRERTTYQVVGIAGDARTQNLRDAVEPRYFVPAEQLPPPDSPIFLIRTVLEPAPIIAAVRQTVQQVDPTLPIIAAGSMEEPLARLTAQDRALGQLSAAFGFIALTLVAVGLYGVLSYGIAQRSSEIAVRMALGAQPRGVITMVLREMIGLVVVGLLAGGVIAYSSARLINARLYGIAPEDPLTFSLAIGLLLLTALVATYLPANRATKVDPMVALRCE